MSLHDITDKLVELYENIEGKLPEVVIKKIFGISDLKFFISLSIKDIKNERFSGVIKEIYEKEVISYEDCDDFLNTISGVDPNDLYINYNDDVLIGYVVTIINIINKAFNFWAIPGCPKGSKLNLKICNDGKIVLYLIVKNEA